MSEYTYVYESSYYSDDLELELQENVFSLPKVIIPKSEMNEHTIHTPKIITVSQLSQDNVNKTDNEKSDLTPTNAKSNIRNNVINNNNNIYYCCEYFYEEIIDLIWKYGLPILVSLVMTIGIVTGVIFYNINHKRKVQNKKDTCMNIQNSGNYDECVNKEYCIVQYDNNGNFLCIYDRTNHNENHNDKTVIYFTIGLLILNIVIVVCAFILNYKRIR